MDRKNPDIVQTKGFGLWENRFVVDRCPNGSILTVSVSDEAEFKKGNSYATTRHNKDQWRETPKIKWRPFKGGEEFFKKARDKWFRENWLSEVEFKGIVRPIKINQANIKIGSKIRISYTDLFDRYEMYDPIVGTWGKAGVLEDSND